MEIEARGGGTWKQASPLSPYPKQCQLRRDTLSETDAYISLLTPEGVRKGIQLSLYNP